MILYCVRHGQAGHNLGNIMNGNPKIVYNLTKKGQKQAQKASESLKSKKIDIIFVSELPRAQQTAKIINKDHKAKIKTDKRLNDIVSGVEGKPSSFYKKLRKKAAKEQKTDIFHARVGKGESRVDVRKRVHHFLNDLKGKKYKSVLVVSHNCPVQAINAYSKNLTNKQMHNFKPHHAKVYTYKLK